MLSGEFCISGIAFRRCLFLLIIHIGLNNVICCFSLIRGDSVHLADGKYM